MESVSFQGVWWNPEKYEVELDELIPTPGLPDGVVAGEAKFEPTEGGSLELIGGLEEGNPDHVEHDRPTPQHPRLHGITIGGRKVTLEGCVASNRRRVMSQVRSGSETWYFSRLFNGVHLKESKISKLNITYTGLESWIDFDFDISFPDDESDYSIQTVDRQAKVGNATVTVRGMRKPTPHEFSPGPDSAEVVFDFKDPIDMDIAISDYIFRFQNLLTLALDAHVFPATISGYNEDGTPKSGFDIYYHESTHQPDLDYNIPIFQISELDFESALQEWFHFSEKVPEVLALVFGTRYERPYMAHLEFLALIISLETLHRRCYPPERQMPEDAFDEYRYEAIESLPDSPAKGRIEDLILNLGNEPSLRTRLDAIGKEYQDQLTRFIDLDALFKEAVGKRHALAHGLETVESSELQQLNPQLRAMTYAEMFDVLGFSGQDHLQKVLDTLVESPVQLSEDEE